MPWFTGQHVDLLREHLTWTEVRGEPMEEHARDAAIQAATIALFASLAFVLTCAVITHLIFKRIGALCGYDYKFKRIWCECADAGWHCSAELPGGIVRCPDGLDGLVYCPEGRACVESQSLVLGDDPVAAMCASGK